MAKARVAVIIVLSTIVLGFPCCRRKSSQYEVEFYKDGSFKSIRVKQDNKYQGESLWFYPSGVLKQKVIFENGKSNGNAFLFYGSGALKTRYYWRNDKQIGYQTDYLDDTVGIIKMVKEFDSSGRLIKIHKTGH